MTVLVADTSALVSLGIVAGDDPTSLEHCFATYDVRVPVQVVDELRDVASYDDQHGRAAEAALGRLDEQRIESVELDTGFPLDDGENAAVTLANELEAELLLCDEFNRLGLIHASLADTRSVTTPTLLSILVRMGLLTPEEATAVLEEISDARSWAENSYVQRARSLLNVE